MTTSSKTRIRVNDFCSDLTASYRKHAPQLQWVSILPDSYTLNTCQESLHELITSLLDYTLGISNGSIVVLATLLAPSGRQLIFSVTTKATAQNVLNGLKPCLASARLLDGCLWIDPNYVNGIRINAGLPVGTSRKDA